MCLIISVCQCVVVIGKTLLHTTDNIPNEPDVMRPRVRATGITDFKIKALDFK